MVQGTANRPPHDMGIYVGPDVHNPYRASYEPSFILIFHVPFDCWYLFRSLIPKSLESPKPVHKLFVQKPPLKTFNRTLDHG